jgi:hypothetical protein
VRFLLKHGLAFAFSRNGREVDDAFFEEDGTTSGTAYLVMPEIHKLYAALVAFIAEVGPERIRVVHESDSKPIRAAAQTPTGDIVVGRMHTLCDAALIRALATAARAAAEKPEASVRLMGDVSSPSANCVASEDIMAGLARWASGHGRLEWACPPEVALGSLVTLESTPSVIFSPREDGCEAEAGPATLFAWRNVLVSDAAFGRLGIVVRSAETGKPPAAFEDSLVTVSWEIEVVGGALRASGTAQKETARVGTLRPLRLVPPRLSASFAPGALPTAGIHVGADCETLVSAGWTPSALAAVALASKALVLPVHFAEEARMMLGEANEVLPPARKRLTLLPSVIAWQTRSP